MLKALRGFVSRALTGTKTVTAVESLFGGIALNEYRNFEDYLRAVSGKVWASWKCCDIVANRVCSVPRKIIKVGTNTPVKNVDLARLLSYPNQTETFGDLIYRTTNHIKAVGNSFWLKDGANAAGDKPSELKLLNPKNIRLELGRDGELAAYNYNVGGKEQRLFPYQVMHFKRPHPDNAFWGQGDIEGGVELIDNTVNRINWEKKFWKNGAAPSGVFTNKTQVDSQENWDKMKRQFRSEYGGRENAGKTAFLNGDWAYEQIGMTNSEMQELERSRFTIEQICHLHGVPLSILGIRDAANYATASIDQENLNVNAVLPMIVLIEDTMNTDLVSGFGDNLQVRFDRSGLINIERLASVVLSMVQNGLLTLNEAREMLGRDRIEDDPQLEQRFISAGLIPLELSGLADQSTTQQQAQAQVRDFTSKLLQTRKES